MHGRAAWRAGMRGSRSAPNVVSKLSGLGTFIHRNDPAHIARIVGETVALFGAGALPVRLELPDREAVDELRRPDRRLTTRAVAATRRGRAGGTSSNDTATRVYRLDTTDTTS